MMTLHRVSSLGAKSSSARNTTEAARPYIHHRGKPQTLKTFGPSPSILEALNPKPVTCPSTLREAWPIRPEVSQAQLLEELGFKPVRVLV